MTLRPATPFDAPLLFDWRNEPSARQHSHNASDLSWDDHVEWLRVQLLNDPRTVFMACLEDGHPIGYGRYRNVPHNQSLVSVGLDPAWRGHGHGRELIVLVTRKIVDLHRVPVAHILPANRSSLAAFQSAGYIERHFAHDHHEYHYQIPVPKPHR